MSFRFFCGIRDFLRGLFGVSMQTRMDFSAVLAVSILL